MTTMARATARTTPVVALATVLAGCAGATVGSGVGEVRLERPPYYAGRTAADVGTVAYTPIGYQRGASQPTTFDPEGGEGTAIGALLGAMNAYLDSLATDGLVGPLAPPAGTPPDVMFGCETDATDECVPQEESGVWGPGSPSMRLAVARPGSDWTARAASALDAAPADALLLLTIEVGQYWPMQTNWRGSKAVELGTDHTMPLPWLTSLDTPVSVLQLTGALVGPDGKAIRIGAEGLQARRTSILVSGIGGQAMITDDDVEALMTNRREDLPGEPLVWQVALRTLVHELTGTRTARRD